MKSISPKCERLLCAGLLILAASLYSTYSLIRHWHFQSSSYDLGIFDQAIWHYSRLELPASTIRGFVNLLGDHFHPILIVLAPLYVLLPVPESLLVMQALLLASSGLPLYLHAKRLFEDSSISILITLSYLSYWGIATAVAFDFHEIAFAVPFIAWSILFMERQQWKMFYLITALLLLVKENQSLLVITFGLILAARRHWRPALITLSAGTVWFIVVTRWLIPFISSAPYGYWNYTQLGAGPGEALSFVLMHPIKTFQILITPDLKLDTIWYIFHTFLGLWAFSTVSLLAVPLIAERFLSTITLQWMSHFHYTATISPILAFSFINGLNNFQRWTKGRLSRGVCVALVLLTVVLNGRLFFKTDLASLFDPSFYVTPTWVETGKEALSKIPSDVYTSVTAQGSIAPHLTQRYKIYDIKLPLSDTIDAEYIVTCSYLNPWPAVDFSAIAEYTDKKRQEGYGIVFEKDGWLVLRRNHDRGSDRSQSMLNSPL